MTIIDGINDGINDGIEINNVNYKQNDIKYAIHNNEPIEQKLNIIVVISNPCLYEKRYTLFREFIKRMEEEQHVCVYVVELIYKNQSFVVTDPLNKNHLQIKTDIPIWHKENMINLGVKLLPPDYKAFAWIDADIEFDNTSWALDTLKILNGSKDVVQLFSHCVDMDNAGDNLMIHTGFGYSYNKGKKHKDFWHPGYAWAITRSAYEKIGGLYDKGVLGSGDSIMALSCVGKCKEIQNKEYSDDYNNSMVLFQNKAKRLRLGYTPGIIRHYYHGSKANRNYTERWKILMKHKYSPVQHLTYDSMGLLIPTISDEFIKDIYNYFLERKEDD
jgi:hypothetical protein